jgi:hypothetical protein
MNIGIKSKEYWCWQVQAVATMEKKNTKAMKSSRSQAPTEGHSEGGWDNWQ